MLMAFVAAAIAMLIALIPAGIVLYRGDSWRPSRPRIHHLGHGDGARAARAGLPAAGPVRLGAAGAAAVRQWLVFVRRWSVGCDSEGIVADVLLGLAVAVVPSASSGAVMRDAYAKLHFVRLVCPGCACPGTRRYSSRWACTRTPVRPFVALLFMVIAAIPLTCHDPRDADQEEGDWRLNKPGQAPARSASASRGKRR